MARASSLPFGTVLQLVNQAAGETEKAQKREVEREEIFFSVFFTSAFTFPSMFFIVRYRDIYGPYLQAIPPLPVGDAKGSVGIAVLGGSSSTQPSGIGWNYNLSTGKIQANTSRDEVDAKGTAYSTY